MLTFAQPWALLAAVGAAGIIVALHFIARRRPRTVAFPTARFVPARSVRAPSRSTRPSDIPLLLLRVLAVLLLGAAFARPALQPERRPSARVVALDLSASGRSVSAARDSAARYLRAGDLLVVFDSAARLITGDPRDSLEALEGSRAAGSISAALVASTRAASSLRDRADSVELVLVSPFAVEEWDGATRAIRELWPGRARLVATAVASDSTERGSAGNGGARPVVEEGGVDDDPLIAVVALMYDTASRTRVRIVRGVPSAADSAWADDAGHVLVHWPASAPEAWPKRQVVDTVGAVAAGSAVLIADFPRGVDPPDGDAGVIARWLDGAPAATESALRDGCVRSVAISIPTRGDVALGESARRFVKALSAPCGGARDLAPPGEARLAALRGESHGDGVRVMAHGDGTENRATPWLLGAAALLLLLELLVRGAGGQREPEGAA
ncbi:MAG TPA: BatA domain-containing protein [Gemmatimonadaceae bacterium]|nr:BatA domain-containing protein [Gemmatimonadaceae bacterium]